MAMQVFNTTGDISKFTKVVKSILEDLTITSSFEDEYIFEDNTILLVYESYSYLGGNRLSISICINQQDNNITLVAITSGGSTGMFFKLNTLGENSFLGDFYNELEKTEKTW